MYTHPCWSLHGIPEIYCWKYTTAIGKIDAFAYEEKLAAAAAEMLKRIRNQSVGQQQKQHPKRELRSVVPIDIQKL